MATQQSKQTNMTTSSHHRCRYKRFVFILCLVALFSLANSWMPSNAKFNKVLNFNTLSNSYKRIQQQQDEENSKRYAFPWFGGGSDEENSEEKSSSKETNANLANVASVMDSMTRFKNSQRIGERTNSCLQDLSNILIEGTAADGKVKVTFSANQKPMGVQIDPTYFQSLKNDKEGSEELSLVIQQAIEEAHTKSTAKMEEKMKALYTDLGFESS